MWQDPADESVADSHDAGNADVPERPEGPGKKKRRRGRWWWLVGMVVVFVSLLVVRSTGGFMSEDTKNVEEQPQLSQQQAYEFVVEHTDNIIASLKKTYSDYEEHGFLKVESVEVIADSVKVSGRRSPMASAEGVISFSYYINGNRDYQVIGDTMIGPYYRGNLPVNVSRPWVPGAIFGDGAHYSDRFNEIKRGWRDEINRPAREAQEAWAAQKRVFVEQHKDKVLEFARERYGDDKKVGRIDSVEIGTVLSQGGASHPEGMFFFRFLINGDEQLEVLRVGMIDVDYPGQLRERGDLRRSFADLRLGSDGASLQPGDIVDFWVYEEWRKKR